VEGHQPFDGLSKNFHKKMTPGSFDIFSVKGEKRPEVVPQRREGRESATTKVYISRAAGSKHQSEGRGGGALKKGEKTGGKLGGEKTNALDQRDRGKSS